MIAARTLIAVVVAIVYLPFVAVPGVPERRISEWVTAYNMAIKSIDERPDSPPSTGFRYVIKDVFTTVNGSWEVSDTPGSIPQWARDDYLSSDFVEAGADHHLFAAVLGVDGLLLRGQQIRYWSDGFDRLGDPDYAGYIHAETQAQSGWANIPIYGGSSFSPERGESGPWCWTPAGRAEVMIGGGLPNNHHISTFVVWQAIAENR